MAVAMAATLTDDEPREGASASDLRVTGPRQTDKDRLLFQKKKFVVVLLVIPTAVATLGGR